jgi:Cd2+/Zn2+-exporting ATPase
MKKNGNGKSDKYREIAVLSIVPCTVGILIIASWALANWKIGPYFLNAGLALFATLFGGYLRFISGFKDIFNRKITVNVFVAVALIATLAIGEFRPAALIVFIMAVAGALESLKGFQGATGSISYANSHDPEKALVRITIKNGEWVLYQP